MSISKLLKAARQYRRRLIEAEDEAIKKINVAYSRALSSSLNELNKLESQIAKMEKDGADNIEIYRELEVYYRDSIDQIKNKINKFSTDADEIVTDLQGQTVQYGNLYAVDNLRARLGRPPVDFTLNINSLDEDALEQFVGLASDGSPLRDLFDTLSEDYGIDVEEYLQVGILQGQNPNLIARKIKEKTYMPLYRAQTIARTESLRAARAATIENYNNNSTLVTKYQRICTADIRTCPACWALHGQEYELNQEMPSHPNCRCVIVPVTPSWAEITGDPSIEDDESDKIPTRDDLFNKLSDKQKLAVLGPDRYELWKQGTSFDDFVTIDINPDWGPTTSITPLRELI